MNAAKESALTTNPAMLLADPQPAVGASMIV
jgi:hypothetical protein